MSSVTNRQNILQLLRNQELKDDIRTKYALKSNLNYQCISKLGLFTLLKGHQRKVNCLQWNKSGSTLASTSYEDQVVLWDPFLQKVKTTITTTHLSNIFSVKFIPGCNDDIIATGGGDWSTHTYNVTTGKKLSSCFCANDRIRRLAIANDSPSLYWCASKDGRISQHDMRMSHECPTDKSKITLVTLYGNSGEKIEAYCLNINQLRTEQLAVGANDQYVRLYDRRMIQSLSSFNVNYPQGYASKYNGYNVNDALQYLVPSHIHSKYNREYIITHLTFSSDGQELLVNCGREYIYLYNLSNLSNNAFFNIPKVKKFPRENGEGSSTDLIYDQVLVPDNVVHLKLKAYYLLEKEDYSTAIVLYNEAINIHKCSELFSDRAAAYIKRKWNGDFYAAFKDCLTALKLEPNHMKAHLQLVISLLKMDKLKESKMYLDQLRMQYPSCKTNAAYKRIYRDLLNAQSNNKDAFCGNYLNEKKLQTSDVLKNLLYTEQSQKITFENYFRNQAKDYHRRYYGHCNYFTDYKEANFFGSQNQFIVSGSDDGSIFVWEKNTENNMLILKGKSLIVNCIQPHPSEFLLATSGIDNIVKLWSPFPDVELDVDYTNVTKRYSTIAEVNQRIL